MVFRSMGFRSDESGKPVRQVTYKIKSGATAVDSVSLFEASWNTVLREWQVTDIRTIETTNASLTAIPAVAEYTHTMLQNTGNTPDESGKPVRQVTYKIKSGATAVDSVSLFDASWNTVLKERRVGEERRPGTTPDYLTE